MEITTSPLTAAERAELVVALRAAQRAYKIGGYVFQDGHEAGWLTILAVDGAASVTLKVERGTAGFAGRDCSGAVLAEGPTMVDALPSWPSEPLAPIRVGREVRPAVEPTPSGRASITISLG